MKLPTIAHALAFAFTLTACGGDNDRPDTDTQTRLPDGLNCPIVAECETPAIPECPTCPDCESDYEQGFVDGYNARIADCPGQSCEEHGNDD